MTDKIAVFISHIGEEAALAHSLKSWIESTFPDQVRVFVSSDHSCLSSGHDAQQIAAAAPPISGDRYIACDDANSADDSNR